MYRIRSLENPGAVCERLMRLLVRLLRAGVIHGDFNGFNLMLSREDKITLIDFPQIVHVDHPNARELFERDVLGVREFFRKHCDLDVVTFPTYDDVVSEAAQTGEKQIAKPVVEGVGAAEDDLLVAAHAPGAGGGARSGGRSGGGDTGESGSGDGSSDGSGSGDDNDFAVAEVDAEGGMGGAACEPLALDGYAGLGNAGDESEHAAFVAVQHELEAQALREGAATTEAEVRSKELSAAGESHAAERAGAGGDSTSENGDSSASGSEDSAAPGQVTIKSGRRIRRKPGAADARRNLQKERRRPAKPNQQKSKEARKAKAEIREHIRD
eukprot:NODE_6343_length_1680_cov_9.169350.p1 GENE.NODE_6343_length_1680_cov_9.169350~~NODE_6343_length_1680_cov_9.169350.p1  ORF type:complete len:346 (+),score=95.24 NODE_6343_length_1680_cov_9.169350:62-1039(+)